MLRYDPIIFLEQGCTALGEMEERSDGDWVNFECAEKLIKKLRQIAAIYENPEPTTLHELSIRAYEMRCIARDAINASHLEQSPNLPPLGNPVSPKRQCERCGERDDGDTGICFDCRSIYEFTPQ